MGVLQRFERRLEGLVEGAFARVFKGEVHPTEIAQALQRESDDRKAIVSDHRVLAPNDFVVELGQHDYDRLSPYEAPLGDELAAMIREHADEEGYTLLGPVSVALECHDDLDTGVFRVRSGVAAGPQVEGAVVRTAAGPGSRPRPRPAAGGLPGTPRLVFAAGGTAPVGSLESHAGERAFRLTRARVLIGRGPDSDLQLADPGVSRRHAELRLEDGVFVLEDLNSTNGTYVNHTPVTLRQLSPGDRIDLGQTTLIFDRDAN